MNIALHNVTTGPGRHDTPSTWFGFYRRLKRDGASGRHISFKSRLALTISGRSWSSWFTPSNAMPRAISSCRTVGLGYHIVSHLRVFKNPGGTKKNKKKKLFSIFYETENLVVKGRKKEKKECGKEKNSLSINFSTPLLPYAPIA